MDLLREITRCPNIEQCFINPQNSNPCSKIISTQKVIALANLQVPEPWSGNLEHAPILFLSSNPSIDKEDVIPRWSWSDEWIKDFYAHRYGGGREQWIEDGIRKLMHDGSRRVVRFWVEVRNRATELLKREIQDGIDYALTEVVHCKSRGEEGVNEAIEECTRHYLRRVLDLSGAQVIVTLGKKAKNALKNEFNIPDDDMCGPMKIGSHQRYVVFLPHPNAHMYRSFEKCLEAEKLQELRAFLRSQLSTGLPPQAQ